MTNNLIGESYRTLREAKSCVLKEAAGTVVSVSQLSTFEHGKTMLTVDKFFGVLQNINVSMIEFQNYYNQRVKEKDPLLLNSDVYDAYMEKNISKLKLILKLVEQEISKNPKIKKYQLDKILVESKIAGLSSSYKISDEEIQQLKTYLQSVKEWGRYELALFGACGKLFDAVTLSNLVHQMIDPTQINKGLYYVQRVKVRTLINVINFFIDKEQFSLAKDLIRSLDNIKVHENYMYEKMTLTYTKAHLSFKETGDLGAIDTMKSCQAAFELCGCSENANWAEIAIAELESKI